MIRYFIRIYPTREQEEKILFHIWCCRKLWNHLLETEIKNIEKNEKWLVSLKNMSKEIKKMKNSQEFNFFSKVSHHSLLCISKDLENAFKRFFSGQNGFPRFKDCNSKESYPVRNDRFYFVNDKYMKIEKIGKVKYKTDFNFPKGRNNVVFYAPRIVRKENKWLIYFAIERQKCVKNLNSYSMGIDLGIKELAVVEFNSQCKVFHNINKSKKMKRLNKKLKYYQRKQSRQYRANPKNKSKKGCKWEKSKNIVKTEDKIRKIHAKIANIRQNYIHQTTHELIEMLPYRIVMEDLKVSNMMKNKHLSKAIGEMCWYEFIRQMKYKCEWNGIEFVQADRFYPSSKTCSCCGNVKKDLKLSDRTYICDICGLTIDRDYNAAVNLSKYKVC